MRVLAISTFVKMGQCADAVNTGTKTTRVHCGGSSLHYTGPTYMPNQLAACSAAVVRVYEYAGYYGYRQSAIEYTSHSIVASCRLLKLDLYIGLCQRADTSLRANRRTLQIERTTACALVT